MKTQTAIIRNDGEAKAWEGVHPLSFLCCDCGEVKPCQREGGTGYAVLPGGALCCYACTDKRQVEALKERAPFVAYVSSDGRSITTWTGGKLARVVRSASMPLTRPSWVHGRTIQAIRAIDVHGASWFGRGNAGIAIKLRPCKG